MDFKKLIPHLIAIGVLLLVATMFFAPNAFSGKVLSQSDNDKARGMATEAVAYAKQDGKSPLWTNSAFGGMPTYQIKSPSSGNLTRPAVRTLFLWTDTSSVWAQVFVAMLCMYLFLGTLKTDWRVSIFGAIAYGITSYNVDILEAGHTTKMMALALTPGIFAGAVMVFNGRLLSGLGLLALFISMQVYANHIQITYYTLLLLGIYGLAQIVDVVKHGTWLPYFKGVAAIGIGVAIGFAANLSRMWSTYEYSQETIRGTSELAAKSAKSSGLTPEYSFDYSCGKLESFTLLVPHYAGGGVGESYTETATFKAIAPQIQNRQQADQQTGQLMYTGSQPFVGTAIYYGAVVIFLAFLGALLARGSVKWWLLGSGIFAITLAWGKYFALNLFLFDHLPMFNKFRAVTMAFGIGQLCFAALGALGLQKICDPDLAFSRKKMALMIAGGGTLLLCLIAWISHSSVGANDIQLEKNPEILELLYKDRSALLQSDVLRSMLFIALAVALVWLYLRGTLKANLTVIAIAALSLVDQWSVCSRTLTSDKYISKSAGSAIPKERQADKQIKQDKDIHYRVLDLARGGITGNGTTSYFHKSLSGYHAAKLQRYQEVVDSFLNGPKLADNLHIVGMFNGKYIITPPQGQEEPRVILNPEACGHAWFVNHFDILPTAEAELQSLHLLRPRDSAVVQQAYATALQGFTVQPDSSAKIDLVKYHPDIMEYEYSAKTEQFAVFPEIYYPPAKGWKTYLNGQPAPDFFKVDYLLRGMRLPAGQNMKLEMRFEPASFYTGEKVAWIASILSVLLFFAGFILWFRQHPLEDPNRLAEEEQPAPGRPVPAAPRPPAPVDKKKGKK